MTNYDIQDHGVSGSHELLLVHKFLPDATVTIKGTKVRFRIASQATTKPPRLGDFLREEGNTLPHNILAKERSRDSRRRADFYKYVGKDLDQDLIVVPPEKSHELVEIILRNLQSESDAITAYQMIKTLRHYLVTENYEPDYWSNTPNSIYDLLLTFFDNDKLSHEEKRDYADISFFLMKADRNFSHKHLHATLSELAANDLESLTNAQTMLDSTDDVVANIECLQKKARNNPSLSHASYMFLQALVVNIPKIRSSSYSFDPTSQADQVEYAKRNLRINKHNVVVSKLRIDAAAEILRCTMDVAEKGTNPTYGELFLPRTRRLMLQAYQQITHNGLSTNASRTAQDLWLANNKMENLEEFLPPFSPTAEPEARATDEQYAQRAKRHLKQRGFFL